MTAKKIENLIRQLYSLEFMVNPAAWKAIRRVAGELKLIAGSAITDETEIRLKLTDLVSSRDAAGRLRVDPLLMGGLFCDLAEAMRDIAEPEVYGYSPGLALVPAPEAI